ncbi:hypothetical protein Pcinc_003489 [Petrolisthes cinctipes]|uniref:Uncharacterized protein n=1 Tax=Petrolisthes cinctipes TaxID=88211 RepID=A0AAE1GIZ3_PETCI|nr:hypothetical protein Pcinc_003489 [Petrolisthes cinctipes]
MQKSAEKARECRKRRREGRERNEEEESNATERTPSTSHAHLAPHLQLRKDIYASFLHCSSTDDNPQHHLCPKTPDSYCFYQRAKANNKPVPSHKTMKVSFQLSSALRQKVWGEYKRLTSDKILSACLLGKTQNPNEHLHSRIWRYCSKYKNANKNILDFSVAQAVLDYNVGYQEGFIVPLLGEPFTDIHKPTLKKRDEKRESC